MNRTYAPIPYTSIRLIRITDDTSWPRGSEMVHHAIGDIHFPMVCGEMEKSKIQRFDLVRLFAGRDHFPILHEFFPVQSCPVLQTFHLVHGEISFQDVPIRNGYDYFTIPTGGMQMWKFMLLSIHEIHIDGYSVKH